MYTYIYLNFIYSIYLFFDHLGIFTSIYFIQSVFQKKDKLVFVLETHVCVSVMKGVVCHQGFPCLAHEGRGVGASGGLLLELWGYDTCRCLIACSSVVPNSCKLFLIRTTASSNDHTGARDAGEDERRYFGN